MNPSVVVWKRRWVTRRTSKGSVYRVWETPMPRIPDSIANCSIYLYKSEPAARQGQDAGGSGFLVIIQSSADPSRGYLYAITNKHLIEDGFCVIRINLKSGDTDCVSAPSEDWIFHPDGDDVAVYPLDLQGDFNWVAISTDMFVDKECMQAYNIGYGDDVFLVGRLIAQSGRQKNTPVIRFGNISLTADSSEKIKYQNREQEAFLIECRSISGFSGSPVFVNGDRFYQGETAHEMHAFRKRKHPSFAANEDPPPGGESNLNWGFKWPPLFVTVGPLLLGIDFGHLPHWNDVYQKTRKTDYRAQSNTGIAGVVPAWKILELLETPSLVDDRAMEDRKLKNKLLNEKPSNGIPTVKG